jgi:hypothetical protein
VETVERAGKRAAPVVLQAAALARVAVQVRAAKVA